MLFKPEFNLVVFFFLRLFFEFEMRYVVGIVEEVAKNDQITVKHLLLLWIKDYGHSNTSTVHPP